VGMVDDVAAIRKTGRDGVEVSGSDRGLDAGSVRGRGVRPHAAYGLLRRSGWRRESRRRKFGRQLVETGERRRIAVIVEHLDARQETIDSKGPEVDGLYRERAAAGAVGAGPLD